MSTITPIEDFKSNKSILKSLREVGEYFYQLCHASMPSAPETRLSLLHDVLKNAVGVLRPLAEYLKKAEHCQKDSLGELLADDPEIVHHLCQGILWPFLKRKMAEVDVVRSLQECLVEFSGMNLRLEQKLIKCGCIHLVLGELYSIREFEKIQHELLESAVFIVCKCLPNNIDLYMQLYHCNDTINTLSSTNCKDQSSAIQFFCQLANDYFSYYRHQSNPGSIDCRDTISKYSHLLCIASESEHFFARQYEVNVSADFLLRVLQCLSTSTENTFFLIENSEFQKAITNLLYGAGRKEIEYALDLLLTLLTESEWIVSRSLVKGERKKEEELLKDRKEERRKRKDLLLSCFPKLLKSLDVNQHGDVQCLKKLCSALLWCVQDHPDCDVPAALDYVKTCYEYRHFEECCYWSKYIIEEQCSTNATAKSLRDDFLLCKAKAKYHIYQRQQVVLSRSEKSKNQGERLQDRERVYDNNAREVISLLGSLKPKKMISWDRECEQFLDFALMDYIREFNKKRLSPFYCMLCHKKETIVNSHAIPESILKIIFKGQKAFLMHASGVSHDFSKKDIHKLTYKMLCTKCDTRILSPDENLFGQKIVKPVYDHGHLQKFELPYEKWLYRFCVGIIFRNLTFCRGVSTSTNADEIHKLFCDCRSVLINESTTPENLHNIAIFFTPGRFLDEEKNNNLVRSLNVGKEVALSPISISGITIEVEQKGYFFAVHFGIFTIVAFLEPVPSRYQNFLIDPNGGELYIPANSDRLNLIPPGLLEIFKRNCEKIFGQCSEIYIKGISDNL